LVSVWFFASQNSISNNNEPFILLRSYSHGVDDSIARQGLTQFAQKLILDLLGIEDSPWSNQRYNEESILSLVNLNVREPNVFF
jgi:hypothetical protein